MIAKHYVECVFKSAEEEEDDNFITGYGSTWNNADQVGDIIAPGAFTKHLVQGKKIPMLWMHQEHEPIGYWSEIIEDAKGLRIKGKFLPSQKAQDAKSAVREGAIDGLSARFTIKDYEFQGNNRVIKEARLREVSIVTFPCNESAVIDVLKAADMSIREIEKHLRDSGFSRAVAEKLLAGGYAALNDNQWDAEKQINEKTIKEAEEAEMLKMLNTIMSKL